jgi:hypothetical protein
LPDSQKEQTSVYLGFVFIVRKLDDTDTPAELANEMGPLQLPLKESKYTTFRMVPHAKFVCCPLLRVRDFIDTKSNWNTLNVSGIDHGTICKTHLGMLNDSQRAALASSGSRRRNDIMEVMLADDKVKKEIMLA